MRDAYYLNPGLPIEGRASDDGLDAPYWDALKQEKILIQQCDSCHTWQWGPEVICHKCRSFDMGWGDVDPQGIIFSWQRVWHPAHAALKEQGPYIVVLVELPGADNVRIVGNLLGDPLQEVRIGSKVIAQFEHHTDTADPYTLLHWKSVGS